MYCAINFKTKKAMKAAVAASKDGGSPVTVFQPGGIFPSTRNGCVAIGGPHYPEPHKWYASATIEDGAIVKVT